MDIVRPANPAEAAVPAVLLIHGGGFRAGNRQATCPRRSNWPSAAMWRRPSATGSRRGINSQRP